MKRIIAGMIVAGSFLLANQVSADSFKSVEIFTVAGVPMRGASSDMVIVELDASARLDAEFSYGLSKDPEVAMSQLQKKLEVQGESLYRKYHTHYTGLARARILGVLKVPAVVVDGQYVVYGETDVPASLRKIKQYMEANRG